METAAAGGAPRALSQQEKDIQMMLAADVHPGPRICDLQMERYRYFWKLKPDGMSTDHASLLSSLFQDSPGAEQNAVLHWLVYLDRSGFVGLCDVGVCPRILL